MKNNFFSVTALVLLIIGGLNWGLIGLFEFDLVAAIFGPMSVLTRIVYALVGLSALVVAIGLPKLSRENVTAPTARQQV